MSLIQSYLMMLLRLTGLHSACHPSLREQARSRLLVELQQLHELEQQGATALMARALKAWQQVVGGGGEGRLGDG